MSTIDQRRSEQAPQLSAAEVEETFRLLGLYDPETREHLLRLLHAGRPAEEGVTWIKSDTGTGYMD